MTRLEMLKEEQTIISKMYCLQLNIKRQALRYYQEQIDNIEKEGNQNREVDMDKYNAFIEHNNYMVMFPPEDAIGW